jgi:hypothetical protein
MYKFLALALVASVSAFAKAPANLPKSFTTGSSKAVFVDFKTANYHVVYDGAKKAASVVATIEFESFEKGSPVFDLVAEPTSVVLDNESVSAPLVKTPSSETTVRVINKEVAKGNHTLVVSAPLTALVTFADSGVKSAYWTSDLSERNFLERYMPANLEFDTVKMNLTIEFKNLNSAAQKIYTNGVVKGAGDKIEISYPDYFNCSAIFFHTTPKDAVNEISFTYKSKDGRDLPVVIYAAKSAWTGMSNLERFKKSTIEILDELEADYGPFPHPTVTIYNAGSGGMEYQGATMTDFGALGHELHHSYFARGVMPANGNSGWMDEAIASWRDNNYPTLSSLSGSSRMSSRAYYTRTTDTAAYSFGARFMAYLDGKFKNQGGVKAYLRHMLEQKLFQPLSIDEYIDEMSSFYGVSVREDFKRYTFGTSNNFMKAKGEHSVHRKMSLTELQNYL